MKVAKKRRTGEGRVSRHRVREGIREMILSGKYRPGEKLGQQQLAKRFGVAQGVIRESLLELKACGLVEAVDNLGVFVSNLSAAKLIEAYEIREVLEGLAARLCCERAGRGDLKELRELAERIHGLGQKGKSEEMGAMDREFHHRIIRISRNEMLERLTESYRVFGKVIVVNRDVEAVRREHLGVLTAIEQNRPEEAERLMREHIRTGRRQIEEQAASGTFVPQWV
jgi:DNA-binding GntR family transcriptional regulator